jgi:hypothetical protein
MAQRIAARIQAREGAPLPPERVEALRRHLQTDLTNYDFHVHFAIERRRFFFIDEFPDNDQRFAFTRDDCLPRKEGRQE